MRIPIASCERTGRRGLRRLLDAAKPAIEFKLDPQIDRLRRDSNRPAAIARNAEALIRELTPREEWDRWRVYVAGRLKVNVDDLRNSRFLANSANFSPRSDGARAAGSRHAPVIRTFGALEPLSFERDVLGITAEDPALALEYANRIGPHRFRNEVYRRAYDGIVDRPRGELRTGRRVRCLRGRRRGAGTARARSGSGIAVRRCDMATQMSAVRISTASSSG